MPRTVTICKLEAEKMNGVMKCAKFSGCAIDKIFQIFYSQHPLFEIMEDKVNISHLTTNIFGSLGVFTRALSHVTNKHLG